MLQTSLNSILIALIAFYSLIICQNPLYNYPGTFVVGITLTCFLMEIILLLLYIFFCGHFWKIIFFYQNVYFNNCRWPGREKQLLGKWIFYIMLYGAPFPLVLEAHCGQMALLSPASPLVLHRMFHQEYFLPFTLCSSPSRSIDGFWALPRPSSFSSAFCLVFLMWSLFALGSYKYFRLFLYIFDLKNRVRISALHFS